MVLRLCAVGAEVVCAAVAAEFTAAVGLLKD